MTEKGASSVDIAYELIVSADSVTLTCGGDVTFVSDGDEKFAKEFGEEDLDADDEAQMDDLLGWLVDEGYVPPGVDVDIVTEASDAPDV